MICQRVQQGRLAHRRQRITTIVVVEQGADKTFNKVARHGGQCADADSRVFWLTPLSEQGFQLIAASEYFLGVAEGLVSAFCQQQPATFATKQLVAHAVLKLPDLGREC